jgi:hypothetical protein
VSKYEIFSLMDIFFEGILFSIQQDNVKCHIKGIRPICLLCLLLCKNFENLSCLWHYYTIFFTTFLCKISLPLQVQLRHCI